MANKRNVDKRTRDELKALAKAVKAFAQLYEDLEMSKMKYSAELENQRMEFAKDIQSQWQKFYAELIEPSPKRVKKTDNDDVVTLEEFLSRRHSQPQAGGSHIAGTSRGQPMIPTPSVVGGDSTRPGLFPDILVTIRRRVLGVVRQVRPDGSCSVVLGDSGEGEVITILSNEIEVVTPREDDRIKIIGGPQRGATGKLLGFAGKDGVVRVDDAPGVIILDIDMIAKLVL